MFNLFYFITDTSLRIPRGASPGIVCLGAACLALVGCGAWETIPEATPNARAAFQAPEKREKLSSKSDYIPFKKNPVESYELWDGDEINIEVLGRPELSGPRTIGSDGKITVGVVGSLLVRGLSRDKAASDIDKALGAYYKHVRTTVHVNKFASNKITVLGRVENPGSVPFDSPPTLIEVLSKAGGFPLLRPEQVLTRCSVIRGDQILWVDVARLLAGDMSLNVQLQRNDVVYIPDAFDTSVFVLGQVEKPGAYRLTPQMSFLDAIAQAGGPTEDSDKTQIHLIRPDQSVNLEVNLEDLLSPNKSAIVALKEGDIIYVPKNGIEHFGYYIRKLSPFSQIVGMGAMAGAM